MPDKPVQTGMNNSLPGLKNLNNLMIISGPSGAGKSTLIRLLQNKNREIKFCVSHTTRSRRRHEVEGKDYHFVTEKKFQQMIEEKRFLEWALVYSHYYGTSWNEIRSNAAAQNVVLDIDVQGARNLKNIYPLAWFVFVIPPSFSELEKRLSNRHRGESHAEIRDRLSRAKSEMSEYGLYDFIVVNDQKERALSILNCIYTAFCHRQVNKKNLLKKMLEE
jgi:guanylate kinase